MLRAAHVCQQLPCLTCYCLQEYHPPEPLGLIHLFRVEAGSQVKGATDGLDGPVRQLLVQLHAQKSSSSST